MQRRSFIKQSVLWTAGCAVGSRMSLWGTVSAADEVKGTVLRSGELYKLFRDPQSIYRPFVRWWWNGDKVEADELKRELHILKEAGIGGVEINPVKFPGNDTDDLGKKSLPWLSDEWIDMLKVAFDEAKSLDMTCDLIVGSGWPFGAEFLTGDDLLIMNGDVYLEEKLLDRILAQGRSPVMFADESRRETADYKFFYEDVILKKYGKELTGDDVTGEYIGIGRFSAAFMPEFICRMEEMIDRQEHGVWWENVVYSMTGQQPVYVEDVSGHFWAEVDYIEDYERILEHRGVEKIVR